MNKQIIKKILATLLMLTLIILICNSNIYVNGSTETTSFSEGNLKKKDLLQYDGDWIVFCDEAEEGEERIFDVKYKGQTQEELCQNDMQLYMNVWLRDYEAQSYELEQTYTNVGRYLGNQLIGDTVPESFEKEDILVTFAIYDANDREIARSDFFFLYHNNVHISYWSIDGNEYEDNLLINDTGKLEVKIKMSEQLEGDISASVTSDIILETVSDEDERNNLVGNKSIENISYENYSDDIIVDNEIYTMKYSIITFEINVLEKVYGSEEGYSLIRYNINFDNVISATGQEINPIIFYIDTPVVCDSTVDFPQLEDTTTENISTEETTVEIEEETTCNEYIYHYAKPYITSGKADENGNFIVTLEEIIDNAYYNVYINDELYETMKGTSIVIPVSYFDENVEYEICVQVKASEQFGESKKSNRVYYTLNDSVTTKPATTINNETTENITILSENTRKNNKPANTTLKSVKNVKKRSVKLTWNKAKNAKKYQVQYSLNKKFKTAKKYKTRTKTAKKLSVTIKKLLMNKTYYFKVRGVNGSVYGKWSKVKKVKIKK